MGNSVNTQKNCFLDILIESPFWQNKTKTKNPTKLFSLLKGILSICKYGTVPISVLSNKEKNTSVSFENLT